MTLTDSQKRLLWGLGILFIFIIWITFPLIFKKWVFTLIVKPPFTPLEFATLGPIGDIFGGLTAFFTSLTLIIVMYSAYLQRQANNDARKAMAEQLQQAKDANAEQLQQARDATAKQLRQARQSIQQQLELAQKTHDAQISESKFTNFSNAFYTLLNYKQSRLNSLKIRTEKGEFAPEYIFLQMSMKLVLLMENEWKTENINNINLKEVDEEYDKESERLFGSSIIGIELVPYYLLYDDLFKLIDNAELPPEKEKFFRGIIFNSIPLSEYYNLIWLAANIRELTIMIEEHSICEKVNSTTLSHFIARFYDKKSLKKHL
ncbi:hypothetical protein B9X71_08950 [Acinetobacter baumannii]|uniref:cell envelope integrity protein TolA n=1 Tax=Acinetobacter baumannii TaxID=470 RepID=UPI000A34FC72|nr:hypothetical protein [Acinetobacter baumannii]OTK46953.1 hypothetical protein B9X71_08950 [Acinetobacter baumannii]